ncbi:MAG TPA: PSD1 and planctomycete cytochrome C domain-containing protein, partial [Gemmataceae bacterium]|nr:PSD1 and planctomycete cytochrome C domain-containing protein [Gemmataceae bacterium]
TSAGAEAPRPFRAADLQFFEAKVRPVLVERCHGCHSAGAKKQRGGLRLDSRAGTLKGGDSGAAVVPGRPDESLLIKAVRYRDESLQMPPKGQLPAREVAALEEWVKRGAPVPEAAPATTAKQTIDLERGRKFWSFQPPREVPPPVVQDRAWPLRRIDHFVRAEQDKRALSPSPPADRRTLIRRVTFDLTGLPPPPEEVEVFVRDGAPDAYERLVERLLASPQYGERWGRFWLDLARYCDVTEQWADVKGPPHLYRDWVVRTFNDDLPYDRFVQFQLAADLLPGAGPADRAALGFLGLSPTYWKELKLDKDVIKTVVAEEWEERIGALGGTFLGLTVACARCHDHKFDPISQKDYYALAGVLASTRLTDRPVVPDAVALQARKANERIKECQGRIGKLRAKKPLPPEAMKQVGELSAEIERLKKNTPALNAALAPAVEEASLMVLADGPHKTRLEYKPGVAQDVAVQVRGNPANLGPVVPRRFLEVLSPGAPTPFRRGSGRLELARAIVGEGAPLSARVIVNRVWAQHFGAGLVTTPSDFGAQGARPSHPQLLDDLTARFLASGWSLKWLHREIVLSATYRQRSAHDANKHAADPDNRWLWRINRRRLEVEAWRDAMLAVAGTLSPERGGPSLDLGDANNRRRTLYGTVKRRELNDLLRLHDFPDPTAHSPARVPTTTPLQQLFTLNSPFIRRQSAALVRRLKTEAPGGDEARVRRAYRLLFGRPATGEEVRLALAFLTEGGGDALWEQYAQVLLGSNEFLFVD